MVLTTLFLPGQTHYIDKFVKYYPAYLTSQAALDRGHLRKKKVNVGLTQDCPGKEIVESEPSNENIQVAEKNLMEKLNKVLIDCVFFALPQVLIFYPRYEVKPKVDSETKSVQ